MTSFCCRALISDLLDLPLTVVYPALPEGTVGLAVTVAFYFILRALNTANLIVSTLSVTTSWFAAMLVFFRSPYYGVAYGLNDVVLVILWVVATVKNPEYLPMVINFSVFLLNDLYGFVNWQRMHRRQKAECEADNGPLKKTVD